MKITIIGTGYVGLVTGVCLSDLGNDVICVDIDEKKIKNLEKAISPIYEPGLEELLSKNISENRLQFTSSIKEGIQKSDIIFIAVGTPEKDNGEADMSAVWEVAKNIGLYLNDYKIIINKSTVPVGSGDQVNQIIKKNLKKNVKYDVVSNPEFLREGSAIRDFLNPDRVVIGSNNQTPAKTIKRLYEPLNAPIIITDLKSAEIIKYASNAFLATKISFINDIANFSQLVNANINDIAHGMGMDKRIGERFLNAGIGYGGSC
ncbi:MAG: nucleotide sugar dehydrogenase, partial [Spirochaetes bacterium]|nr:nucleotide sugar dehydrogenase [Spirochaetota bacterium]